jgi:nucleolar complex protein 3
VTRVQVLHKLAMDGDVVVARLASLSALLVFKDLAPGYRIRPPTEKELEMTVSKEVRAMRDYESAFLKGAMPGASPAWFDERDHRV